MQVYKRKTTNQIDNDEKEINSSVIFLEFVELWEDIKLFERISWRNKVKDILDSYIIIDSSKELILNQIVDYIIKKYPTSDVFEDECGWSSYTEYSAEQILNEKLILLGKAFRYHQTITNGGK